MERSEKRRLERERQKFDKQNIKEDENNKLWFSQLSISKKIFIGKFIERRAIDNDNLIASIMDKCVLGAIDDNTNIDPALMKKIIDEYNQYILEYKEFLDEYKDGGFDMIDNKVDRQEIAERMVACINKGDSKVKCMAEIKKLYKLPAAELSNLWIDCKKEVDILNKKGPSKDNLEFHTTKPREPIVTVSDDGLVVKFDSVVDEVTRKTNLKVVNITREIEGEFGYYKYDVDGITCGDTHYNSKSDLDIEMEQIVSVIDNDISELKEKLRTLEEDRATYLGKYGELEQVFDM